MGPALRAAILRLYEQETALRREDIGFDAPQSLLRYGTPIAIIFATCQELIVQSIDLARLIGRDILQMQCSQLMLGWLVIVTISDRPWSLVK